MSNLGTLQRRASNVSDAAAVERFFFIYEALKQRGSLCGY